MMNLFAEIFVVIVMWKSFCGVCVTRSGWRHRKCGGCRQMKLIARCLNILTINKKNNGHRVRVVAFGSLEKLCTV